VGLGGWARLANSQPLGKKARAEDLKKYRNSKIDIETSELA